MSIEENGVIKVLIPDGESHLTVSVINCLQQTKNIQLYILSATKNNPARVSAFVHKFILDVSTIDDDFQFRNSINAIIENYKINVLMPVFEFGIKRIIKIKSELSPRVRIVPLPNLSTFDIANNKWNLYQHCVQAKIFVPRSYHTYELRENNEKIEKYPLVTKPLEGFGGGLGISLIHNQEELRHFLSRNKEPRIFQNYIKGYDIDCSLLAINGKIMSYTIQRGIIQNDNSFKPSKGIIFEENQVLFDLVQNLIASLQYTGIAHIDLRFDTVEKTYKILEINPRIWLTIMGSYKAGINFVLQWIEAAYHIFPEKTEAYAHQSYFNRKRDIIKKVLKSPKLLLDSNFFKKQTPFSFMLRDPFPVFYRALDSFKNVVVRKIRKIQR